MQVYYREISSRDPAGNDVILKAKQRFGDLLTGREIIGRDYLLDRAYVAFYDDLSLEGGLFVAVYNPQRFPFSGARPFTQRETEVLVNARECQAAIKSL